MKDRNGVDLSISNKTGDAIEITNGTTNMLVDELENCDAYPVESDPKNGPVQTVTISRSEHNNRNCECGYVKLKNRMANAIVIADPLGSGSGSLEPYGSTKIYNESLNANGSDARSKCMQIIGISYEQLLSRPFYSGMYAGTIPTPRNLTIDMMGNYTAINVTFRAPHTISTLGPYNIQGIFDGTFIIPPVIDMPSTMTLRNVKFYNNDGTFISDLTCFDGLIMEAQAEITPVGNYEVIFTNPPLSCEINGIAVSIEITNINIRIDIRGPTPKIISISRVNFRIT
ncbi:MAG: hypothetical protein Hyperionvirus2_124 [Hyperionvirus sp.]|uniref:Uncharacterized protein n=1 Tax=Hyperionvirus sp. TaxID=2487770 RepID=A0A3G5A676_9VIRU|nr:MAG: hypothetical protein Hyperionvirus2_124 [Hyperionvirus sp.]